MINTIGTIAAIGAGGAIGAMLRHGVNSAGIVILGNEFPYGTFIINILGSFLLGLVITLCDTIWTPSDGLKAFIITGILSSFTTFAVFSSDVVNLLERQSYVSAGIYYIGSVTLSVIALCLAIQLVKSITT